MNVPAVVVEDCTTAEAIEAKILHLLSIYPIISPTMLQGGLGGHMKPAVWRPVLEKLIGEGRVAQTQKSMQTPTDRYNSYTMLSLADTKLNGGGREPLLHDG